MLRTVVICAALVASTCAHAQQTIGDRIVAELEQQRNSAQSENAVLKAQRAMLAEENTRLKGEIEDMKKKAPKQK